MRLITAVERDQTMTIAPRSMPTHVHAALAASQVGTWETNTCLDRTIADETTAALFGVDPAHAAQGLPLEDYARAIHHEDLRPFYDKLDHVRTHGGLFVVEYRTRPQPGCLRWILARGRYERDGPTGAMMGRGIVIDITESKLDGRVEDRAFFLAPDDLAAGSPLDDAAAHAIAARRAIERIQGPDHPVLRRAVDALLWALGRALVRHTPGQRAPTP